MALAHMIGAALLCIGIPAFLVRELSLDSDETVFVSFFGGWAYAKACEFICKRAGR